MKRPLLWRGLVILASILAAIAAAYPPKDKINLGLDLRGGMHLMLQVHTEDALRAETDGDMARLAQQVKDDSQGKTDLKPQRTADTTFVVPGLTPDAKDAVTKFADKNLTRFNRNESADNITFSMRPDEVAKLRELSVSQAVQTIRNRIDAYGVTEPVIQAAGGERILVQLPGVDDFERVRALIKNTAFLEFRITRFPKDGAHPPPTKEEILTHYGGHLPDDVEILEGTEANDRDNGGVVETRYWAVDKRRTVTGRDLRNARPALGQMNQPIVEFSLTPDGARSFGDLTGNNVGSGLAIVLDGRIVEAPVIHSRITDSGIIEGSFTQKQVEDISTLLRSGALPASITYLEERTVGPSLGRDSIDEGLLAGLVGTILVVVVMLLVYRLSGVNAIAALVLNVLLLFGGMGLFHSTMTLPGIAGVILTIGMAVDANVLVFERIREELRAGRTVRSAIDHGFDRAFTSIIDTHVTTLISATFLFQFGTGPIKGFAVTLTIGLLASLYTSVFVSRWIFDLVLSRRKVQSLSI
jgi:preprotein translocase subunit SecD